MKNFESVPQEKPKRKTIKIEGGGEVSLSPEEEREHEKHERRRSIIEHKEIHEAEEPVAERTLDELTDEEREILAEIVPDEETRARLAPEVIEMFLRAKKEEKDKEEAA